ncbi:MAG: hypothetical protein JNJ40_11910 [Bacteroidia bacterium]|nr:hypothetical protein [Bacteroidia bacterium]
MKRLFFYLIAALPFILYFFKLVPSLVADELPDKAFITPFTFEGKNYYTVFAQYEQTNENSRGQTSHSISEKVLIFDPEVKKIVNIQHLNGDIKKMSNGYLWDINSDNGLFLYNPLNGNVLYTEKDLAKIFPNLKERGTYYNYRDSIWKIKYNDGSEESFNENKIPELQMKIFNAYEVDYKNKWSTNKSSGERSFIVYNKIQSKNDFLDPQFINDSYTGKLIALDNGSKCLISFQKEVNGSYYFALIDSAASVIWEKPGNTLASVRGTQYALKDKNELVNFGTRKATGFNLTTGAIAWEASYGGDGLMPNWLFWTLAFSWAIIFGYFAEPKTSKK